MAIFRFSLKSGSRANGKRGAAHACYILRTERYDYGAHELKHSESGNLPEWATSPTDFWNAADSHERLNAEIYREFEIALPRELSLEQQIKLTREFLQTELGERHPYTMAIHEVPAMDGGTNPHAHVMFTTRTLDGIERSEAQFFKRANAKNPEQGGAPKDRSWKPRSRLYELRESWQNHCNGALSRAGHDCQIDARSYREQQRDRSPEPKLTPYESMLWKQGILSENVTEVLLLREIASLERQQESNEKHLATLNEIATLTDLETRVGETLAEQRKALDSHLRELETVGNRIEILNSRLENSPTSQTVAYAVAKERMFERGEEAHVDTIKALRERRDQEIRHIQEHLGKRGLKGILEAGREAIKAFETQLDINAARWSYQNYRQAMTVDEANGEVRSFGEKLYRQKEKEENERNQLLTVFNALGDDIRFYRERLIPETEAMLDRTRAEITTATQTLSPAVRAFVFPEHAIEVGQDVETNDLEREQHNQSNQLRQEQTLELALELAIRRNQAHS